MNRTYCHQFCARAPSLWRFAYTLPPYHGPYIPITVGSDYLITLPRTFLGNFKFKSFVPSAPTVLLFPHLYKFLPATYIPFPGCFEFSPPYPSSFSPGYVFLVPSNLVALLGASLPYKTLPRFWLRFNGSFGFRRCGLDFTLPPAFGHLPAHTCHLPCSPFPLPS